MTRERKPWTARFCRCPSHSIRPSRRVDARKATPPPRFELKPPKGAGAPNVVFVLMDNFGFGDPGCFGGPVNMPAFERLANGGLRYNNMHTAPVCSPTRVALLTGRNSHSANMGGVAEMGTAFPGMNCAASPDHRTAGRNSAAQRLRHRDVRQVPRAAAVGIECLRTDGPLAGALRIRQVLRLPSGRVRPLRPGTVRWRDPHPHATRSGLPRQHRHHRQGHRLGPHAAVTHAGQAILHLLRGGGHARPASCAEAVDRQVQGPVRRRLGDVARADAGPADQARHGPGRHEARADAGHGEAVELVQA